MVSCSLKNWQGEVVGEASIDLKVAKAETAHHVVHRALVRQLNGIRQGNASTKTRSEVRGGGRKPWRQKGTGRARAGSSRSPLWKGGGVIFGPKPRDYGVKMNRKERKLAIRTAFVSKAENIVAVELFAQKLTTPKTKEMLAALSNWGVGNGEKVLLVLDEISDNVYLSVRNVPRIRLIKASSLNVQDVLLADKIVVTPTALEKIKEVYGD